MESQRFLKAKTEHIASLRKHCVSSWSSSEEDEDQENAENILDIITKRYSELGGGKDQVDRLNSSAQLLLSGASCLICLESIRRSDKCWSCDCCYAPFHIDCISKWAKDFTLHQKKRADELKKEIGLILWPCPKCREKYPGDRIPKDYYCFCGAVLNPEDDPWLVPHSCGEICRKPLKPPCGHACNMLCHPGPCPPCPQITQCRCYCGKGGPTALRCSVKEWSCGRTCDKRLSCGNHGCPDKCHPGDCGGCGVLLTDRACLCGKRVGSVKCGQAGWNCGEICGKMLACGSHTCQIACHKGDCGVCPFGELRTCPCGKTAYTNVPCDMKVKSCGDTCGKVLECGLHSCSQRCHSGPCGKCLERVVKDCRCGKHKREVPCYKEAICDSKCKKIRDCGIHYCHKKCCSGECPSCDAPCGKTLSCGVHKCESVCHRGKCYPCDKTNVYHCSCKTITVQVPCGTTKRARNIRCSKKCGTRSDCIHDERTPHRCHFGPCPPCKQICNKIRTECGHACQRPCHTQGMTAGKGDKENAAFECGPCMEAVIVPCFGYHKLVEMACSLAKAFSCASPCDRILPCHRHSCVKKCHKLIRVENSGDMESDVACGECRAVCGRYRCEGCPHACEALCHAGPCQACEAKVKIPCHCGGNSIYVDCNRWTSIGADEKDELISCKMPCTKLIKCGHVCSMQCHSGDCSKPEDCEEKVKIYCDCKRLKKDVKCSALGNYARSNLPCNDACHAFRLREKVLMAEKEAALREEEEERNKRELEEFQRKILKLKKGKGGKARDKKREDSFASKAYVYAPWTVATVLVAVSIYFAVRNHYFF